MKRIPLAIVALALCAGLATAQFTWMEGFEPYNLGSLCSGASCANAGSSGGWGGWDNVDAVAGTVVDMASASFPVTPHGGSQMLQTAGTNDAVQPFVLNNPGTYPTSGRYEIVAWCYIPTGGLTADTYFIVNNEYNHGGPYAWSLELHFRAATGTVIEDYRGGSLPIAFDQWALIQAFVDLDADTLFVHYNGQLLAAGSWSLGNGYPPAIQNIDLFTTGGTTFYDDLSITPRPDWETNSPAAFLDIDGVQVGPNDPAPARVTRSVLSCPIANPAGGTLNFGTNVPGSLFDIGLNSLPLLSGSGSGLDLPDGQIVNLNLTSITWFNGGLGPAFIPVPGAGFPGSQGASVSAPFSLPVAQSFRISGQGAFTNPAAPLGFELTQGVEFVVNVGNTIAGPAGDETTVSLSAEDLCIPGGVFPFYGMPFTTIHVISNGRITFGTADQDCCPTSLTEALDDPGMLAFWTDLDPGAGGSVAITKTGPSSIRVEFNGVPYYAEPATANTIAFEIDAATGNLAIEVSHVDLNPGTSSTGDSVFMGVSPPGSAADPGGVVFSPGANGSATGANAIYDYYDRLTGPALPASVAAGVSRVDFIPNGSGNYTWIAQ